MDTKPSPFVTKLIFSSLYLECARLPMEQTHLSCCGKHLPIKTRTQKVFTPKTSTQMKLNQLYVFQLLRPKTLGQNMQLLHLINALVCIVLCCELLGAEFGKFLETTKDCTSPHPTDL